MHAFLFRRWKNRIKGRDWFDFTLPSGPGRAVIWMVQSDLDLTTARRVNQKQKRINVDFPSWVVDSLDREAARIGVTRQSIIKVWLVERFQAEATNEPSNEAAAARH